MPDSIGLHSGMRPNSVMTAIGYLMFVLMIPLLLPLVPFFLAFFLVDWLTGESGVGRRDEGPGPGHPEPAD